MSDLDVVAFLTSTAPNLFTLYFKPLEELEINTESPKYAPEVMFTTLFTYFASYPFPVASFALVPDVSSNL